MFYCLIKTFFNKICNDFFYKNFIVDSIFIFNNLIYVNNNGRRKIIKLSSDISKIISSYKASLNNSQSKYLKIYESRGENSFKFHINYGHKFIIDYSKKFLENSIKKNIQRQINKLCDGEEHLDFVAIDGSCYKDIFDDFIVFSACAYGAKGNSNFQYQEEIPKIKYKKWSLNKDVSMVAYVPIPFAELAEVTDNKEEFIMSDYDRINLSNVHSKLMQLSEIYLAYNIASSSNMDAPKLILLDLLPSSTQI